MNTECTCPEPEPHEGLGVPIRLPGKAHRRGCPVVADFFAISDDIARRMAAEHVAKGGIIQTPGERAEAAIWDLARRVERLEAEARARRDTA